ncbi:GpE family phage tail protein [Aliivibrio logei]|uniref:GpE family phage tail protein n=1 Tax=Aliivibrio logei TaxID=688 RepID=UPI0030DA9302
MNGGNCQFFREYETIIEQFNQVEEFYADLAIVFHWSPSEVDKFSIDDLILFREMARVRHQGES